MRSVNSFVAVLTAILVAAYLYLAWRLTSGPVARLALAVPFLLIWIVPLVYWVWDRESGAWVDEIIHFASYTCMGWINFLLVLSLARDGLLLATRWTAALSSFHESVRSSGGSAVMIGSFVAFGAGLFTAMRGPHIRHVDIPVEGLEPGLDGVRIVQITDLHIGPTIREAYVGRVARMANALSADLVVLTGDIVDGSVARLARHVAPLGELSPAGRVFLVLGNHEYYSGAAEWIEHFKALNFRVLLNEYHVISIRGTRMIVGGVLDAAERASAPLQRPRPDLAAGLREGPAFRLLLAHHPNIAPSAESAGFDLQLSGHTHAGQFFPWTLAVHLVHAPHAAGLAQCGRMWVYVSAGTGTWGPPVRFGTVPELTLIRLTRR